MSLKVNLNIDRGKNLISAHIDNNDIDDDLLRQIDWQDRTGRLRSARFLPRIAANVNRKGNGGEASSVGRVGR